MSTTSLKGAHLSHQQSHLWQFHQEGGTYRSQCTISINGTLHYSILQQSLQHLFKQHTIFQTLFYPPPGMDTPIQVIGHNVDFHCPIIDLEGLTASEQGIMRHTLLCFLQKEPFDVAHGPLYRSALFRISTEVAFLFISLSALCSDSYTLPLLIAALVKRYNACISRQEFNEEPLQYAAISAWQKQVLLKEGDRSKSAKDFWSDFNQFQITKMDRLIVQAGVWEKSRLQAEPKKMFELRSQPVKVSETLSIDVRALAFFYDVSPQAILLACWLILLRRLVDEPQLVIGVACNGRNHEELVEVLGLYTRFVPFSAHIEENWTFKQVLALVEPLLEKTIKYQSYFTWSSVSDTQDSLTDSPFFPVAFEYERWPASFAADDLSLSLEQQFCCIEPFIIKLSVLQIGEELRLELQYDARRVVVSRLSQIASMVQVLLQSIVEQPQATVSLLSLLSNEGRSRLLALFRAPVRVQPTQSLHRLFEAHARRRSDELAVVSTKDHLTYQQLNERANRLAWVLRKRGICSNVLVGLCMARTAQMLVGLLGILKAGGAYLPLDASNPPVRLLYQLQDSRPTVLLTQQEMRAHLPEWEGETLLLEELEQEMAQASKDDLPDGSEAEDLAYIIYTSGSTGTPKGVMIRQCSVVNYTLALCEQLKAEPGWHYATVSTLAADLGNTAIFCGLASGGCVQVLDYEIVTSAQAMAKWMKQYPIDVLKIVPSHLSALLAEGHGEELLPCRALVVGGEVLPTGLLEQISASGSTCEVYNHYGPTETTIGVLVNPLGILKPQDEKGEEAYATIPLGRPITNTEAYVLDRQMQVVPVGVTGELYIAGVGLAMGYIQQAGLTAERFVPHPYSQPGTRLYRTGDLARYSEEGQIAFVGRGDSQIKLRGYRIELAEIEALLRHHPNIRDSAVVVHDDSPHHLVGYIVPREVPVPVSVDVQNFLRHHLPEYMVCQTFVYLKSLPLTANGKVDRRQLITTNTDAKNALAYLIDAGSRSRKIVQPRSTLELQLLQIWEDVLEVQPISVVDDFFQLGGHSLLAVRLISRLSKYFQQDLDMAILFQYSTIAELAIALRQQVPSAERVLVALQPHGTRPPFFCVHPSGGTVFCYVPLARALGPDQPFYGLQNPIGEVLETVEELATLYLTALRTVQPQGPYLLGGWSLGGMIAFEMAQQLLRQGDEVSLLAIIDSTPSHTQRRAEELEKEIDFGDTGVVKELLDTYKITVPDDFDQRDLETQITYVMDYAKKINSIPADISLEVVRRYARIIIANEHLASLYVPQEYEQKIDYFIAADSLQEEGMLDERETSLERSEYKGILRRWHTLATGGIEIHHLPGKHIDIVEEPNVQVLATALQQCIDRICGQVAE